MNKFSVLNIQAIFFDFDGVLVESSDIKTEAFLELFKSYPEHSAAIRKYHIDNMGVSRYVKIEWILKNILQEEVSNKKTESYADAFSEIVLQKVIQAPEVEGATELLKLLINKVKLFVVSGTPEAELQMIVEKRNWSGFFESVKGTPKTKTTITTELITQYNFDPSKCLFIGDAITDYDAAINCNVPFIARNSEDMSDFWKMKNNILIVHDMTDVVAHFNI